MTCFWRIIALTSALAAACVSGFGQTAEQPVVLIIDSENIVSYWGDVTDATRLSRDPGPTAAQPPKAFQVNYGLSRDSSKLVQTREPSFAWRPIEQAR